MGDIRRMTGFFIKKAFFDGWDNLFQLVGLNAVHLAIVTLTLVLPPSLGAPGPVVYVLTFLGIAAIAYWQSVCAHATGAMAGYRTVSLRSVRDSLKPALVPGIQAAAYLLAAFVGLTVGIPFYLSSMGLFGAFAAGLLFWSLLVSLLVFQYYLPLRAARGGGFRENLRKSLLLAVDNVGFSLFLLAYTIVTFALSAVLAFLVPGFAGVSLAGSVAVRLRLKKYDWLEGHPGTDRRSVPWGLILEEEKDLVGKRTLKGMIFPWKEG